MPSFLPRRTVLALAGAWALGAQAAPARPRARLPDPWQALPKAAALPADAVPYYTPGAFVTGVLRWHHLPRVARFEAQARALAEGLDALCHASADGALTLARRQWTQALEAWVGLSAVAVGPLIERRSARAIDFQPSRPALIERAMAQAPAALKDLDTVGAPARGLPALEWLLWTRPVRPGSAECRYAALLGRDVLAEAQALRQGFEAAAARPWREEEEAASAFMGEIINQWVGALEALRWRELSKPLASAPRGRAPEWARAASGQSAVAWAAHWQAIEALSVLSRMPVPMPGEGLVPIDIYLRGRGLNPLADRLVLATAQAGRVLEGLTPAQPRARLQEAISALGRLKLGIEDQVAPALEVAIGFSDADGD